MVNFVTAAHAASARTRIGLGASLPRVSQAAPRDRATSAFAAEQVKFALRQPTSQKLAHKTTGIAALGGGAVGPHPGRDPV